MTESHDDAPEAAGSAEVRPDTVAAADHAVARALSRALATIVPSAADYAFVHLATPQGLVACASRHRDPALQSALDRLLKESRLSMTAPGSPVHEAYMGGGPQLSDPDAAAAGDGDAGRATALGPRSFLSVPLDDGRVVRGVLTLARQETDRPYGPRESDVAVWMGRHLAVLVEVAEAAEARWAEARRDLESERAERAALQEAHRRSLAAQAESESARQALERDQRESEDARREAEERGRQLEAALREAEAALRAAERRRAAAEEALAAAEEGGGAASSDPERSGGAGDAAGQGFEAKLLDAVSEAVIATDLEGRIIYWNRGAERLYGWSRGEAVGRDLGDTAPAVPSREKASEAMARMMAGGSWSGELEVRRKDGTTFLASLTGTPIFSDDGEAVGLISISTDLTGQKRLEERLMQAQRAQAVGRVAGGVAHELNNCLTSISGHAELLRRQVDADDPLRGDLDAIDASSRRAAGLIHQLLAYSRRQVLQPRVVSLNAVVRGMSSVMRSLLGEKIAFTMDLRAHPDTARVDQGQLEQVVTYLVLNAHEAIPEAGRVVVRTANVELTPEDAARYSYPVEPGRYVALLVEDDGVGMDAETLQHAFEPFYTTKEDVGGAGLGLSTTYGVMKQSGGYVWIDSFPGEGTTVRLVLPEVGAEQEVATDRKEVTAPRPGRPGGVILLVEDDVPVLELARRVLEQEGHEILAAPDGMAALALWEDHRDRIDLVVTDVVMPQMSGRALVDRLRTQRPRLPALFMSGYTDDGIGMHRGAETRDPFLGKPFTAEALTAEVRHLLSDLTLSGTP